MSIPIFGRAKAGAQESNPYGISTDVDNIRGPLTSLRVLYDNMPATVGCENCASCHPEKDYCCKKINPSMYYIEFLYVWEEVQKWGKKKRLPLILRAIETYLSNADSKGCIFYDDGCLIYEKRPFACCMYGVISPQSWERRIVALKKEYDWEAVSEDFKAKTIQCSLVSCENGDVYVSDEQEQKWFQHTARCESRIGVTPATILEHDGPKGSYRTFHDHIMLEFVETEALSKLTQVKMSLPSKDDIKAFTQVLFDKVKGNLRL